MNTRREWNQACVETLQQRIQALGNEARHTEHMHWNDAMGMSNEEQAVEGGCDLATYRLQIATCARNHANMAHTAEAMLMHAATLLDQLERVDLSYQRADVAPK